MSYVFEVLVYFKVDSVVYSNAPDQLLYHETIRFKGTSKPFKIISTSLAFKFRVNSACPCVANSTAIIHHVIISLTQQ